VGLGALVDASTKATFSSAKADLNKDKKAEWLSFIAGPSLALMSEQLKKATTDNYIPYAATLGKYITADDAKARWAALTEFNRRYGHFWIGTGAYYLERAFPVEGVVLLQRYAAFPDLATRWDRFGAAAIAVVEVKGPTRVQINTDAAFDVAVTFGGKPYAKADIEQVKYLLFDAKSKLAKVGEAAAVADGQWKVTLGKDVTSQLEAGSNRLEVVVVSKRVALPTFASSQFVTAP
jgi:peptide/nickel transport system substrate-binding protein